MSSAWLWMTAALSDPERQRYCLEKALEISPGNRLARTGLERLQPPILTTGKTEAAQETIIDTYEIPEEPEIEIIPEGPIKPGQAATSEAPTTPARRESLPDTPPSPAEYTRSGYVITIGWVTPRRSADRVVLLEPDALIVANPDFEYLSPIRQQLVVGPVPHQLLGLTPCIIPLDQIEQVGTTARDRRLHLRYNENGRAHNATVRFADRDDCNDAFHHLQRRLGEGFVRIDRRTNRWLVGLTLAGLVTIILTGMAALLPRLGGSPVVILVAGGLLLGALIWLIPYLGSPLLHMALERTGPPAPVRVDKFPSNPS